MAYQDMLNQLFSGGLLAQDVGLPPEIQQRAQQQALLNAGVSILAGSGRRRGPKTSLAELAAGGIQAGQQGYQGALQSGMARQDYQGQQAARQAKQAMREELSALPADQSPESFVKRAQIFEKYGDYDNAQKYYDAAQKFSTKQGEAYTLTPGSVRFGPDGKVIASVAAAERQGADPYYQAVPTPQGYMRFNARTGQMEPIMVGGSVPTPIAADPYLKQQMEQAGATGRVTGETRAEQALAAPQALTHADQILENIDSTLNAPGLSTATGLSSVMDPRSRIPGTAAYDAKVKIEQIKGQAFLQAFESLKGGGAITEREGQAATAAIGRLNTAQSDKAFRDALIELRGIVQRARDRQASRLPTSGAAPAADAPASEADALRRALEKYR